jgi:hypothetical protein
LSAWKISAPQRIASLKFFRALGHHHEFLEVDRGVGVRAAVDDVHHGDGQDLGVGTAEVLEERLAELVAAAWALAMDTARMAFAPSFALFFVPSSTSMAWSTSIDRRRRRLRVRRRWLC